MGIERLSPVVFHALRSVCTIHSLIVVYGQLKAYSILLDKYAGNSKSQRNRWTRYGIDGSSC